MLSIRSAMCPAPTTCDGRARGQLPAVESRRGRSAAAALGRQRLVAWVTVALVNRSTFHELEGEHPAPPPQKWNPCQYLVEIVADADGHSAQRRWKQNRRRRRHKVEANVLDAEPSLRE